MSTQRLDFSSAVYRIMTEGFRDNTLVSPLSIESALARMMIGARGTTRDEMGAVLGLTGMDNFQIAVEIERMEAIRGAQGVTLDLASRIFVQTGEQYVPSFLDEMARLGPGGVGLLDFRNPEAARLAINAWVAAQTHDKIDQVLSPGAVDTRTSLVLPSAVYFKGLWERPFPKRATEEGVFHGIAGARKAFMMNQSGKFGYSEGKDFQLVVLPYQGNEIVMIVVLPREGVELARVEERLSLNFLRSFVESSERRQVTGDRVYGRPSLLLRCRRRKDGSPTNFHGTSLPLDFSFSVGHSLP